MTVDAVFSEPLAGLVTVSRHARPCPEYRDDLFVRLGVQRVLETSGSGRAFLQEHGVRFADPPGYANYFAALKSTQRCLLLRDVHDALVATATLRLPDRLADIPELANYECLAADGHWHRGAVHDPWHDWVKMAVGHFYSLDLRRHPMRHRQAALVHSRFGGPAGHPAQRQVHPLAPPGPPRSTRGSLRLAPPPHSIRRLITKPVQHLSHPVLKRPARLVPSGSPPFNQFFTTK